MAPALSGLGGIALCLHQNQRAAYLLAAAKAANETLVDSVFQAERRGEFLNAVEQKEFESDLVYLKGQLDPDDFTAAWHKGRDMSPQRAILEAYKIKPGV